MHEAYGGVVPELASRDHIRRLVPLTRQVLGAGEARSSRLDGIAYTEGPGLAGALLVGASIAHGLGLALRHPGARHPPPRRPPALAASLRAARRHFRSSRCSCPAATPSSCASTASAATRCSARRRTTPRAKPSTRPPSCSASAIPAGRRCRALADTGMPGAYSLPRPMLDSGDLDFSFSGLKTAVLTRDEERAAGARGSRARVRRRDRRRAGGEVPAGAASHRTDAPGRRRRRRREPPAARGARCRGASGAASRCSIRSPSSAPTTAR